MALLGLAVVTLSVVGISEQADRHAQRDVILVSAADDAYQAFVGAQQGLDPDQFLNGQDILNDAALQQNVYSWALDPISGGGLGLTEDPLLLAGDDGLFGGGLFDGTFTVLTEADLIGPGPIEAQLDQLLDADAALAFGGDGLFVGQQFVDDLAGVAADSSLGVDVTGLFDPGIPEAGFADAVLTWPGEMLQAGWSDLFDLVSAVDMAP
ncbi:hypothetical protein [Mycolicibacter minnesotensis]